MLNKTTYNQFVTAAAQAVRVLVYQEIYADLLTPAQVFQSLGKDVAKTALLEFAPRTTKSYAFIGLDPIAEFNATGHNISIQIDGQRQTQTGDPFTALRQLREHLQCGDTHPLLNLTGGAVGYMSYDAIRLIEALPDRHLNEEHIPDISLNFYGSSVTFDYESSKVIIAKIVTVTDDLAQCYHDAMQALADILQKLQRHATTHHIFKELIHNDDGFEVDLSDEEYANIVNKAKAFIRNGDIFQVVSSRTFKKKYHGDTFTIYHALKNISPSPYHFYIRNDDMAIVGASPEKIVSLHNNVIESTPLAGTRPRGHNGNDDASIATELLHDEKEIAEHMMLVDLARNDIGAVAQAGTVKMTEEPNVVNFSHVMHIASTVQGTLAEKHDALDVLKANFPAGTLSGAPKIRAMEIIDTLENSRRGIYGGAIIALDRADNLDTCIAIRTAMIKNGVAQVRAGSGIVHDSDPFAEAQETRHKARSVMTAIETAAGATP